MTCGVAPSRFLGLALICGLALSACQSTPQERVETSMGKGYRGLVLSQTAQFGDDGLKLCATLDNQSEARLLLRAPLGFGGGRQFRALLGPPLSAPLAPQGPAPDKADMLSYDILEPLETRAVCTILPRAELPDVPFRLETLYQPWTREGDALPLDLAFRPGLRLLSIPEEGALSGACLVDPGASTVDCAVPPPT